jgi:hypothetical protein
MSRTWYLDAGQELQARLRNTPLDEVAVAASEERQGGIKR